MGVGVGTPTWKGGGRGGKAPWILEISAKKIVFLISSGKKQISPLLTSPWKNFGKIPWCPPRKKSS